MRNLEDDAILKTIVNMVVPFIIVFGIYVILKSGVDGDCVCNGNPNDDDCVSPTFCVAKNVHCASC